MAYALVGTIGTVSLGAANTAVTPAWGTSENRTAKNLLICWVAVHGTATLPTTPNGWNIGVQKAGTSMSVTAYWRVATGADAAPQIGAMGASTYIQAQLAEFSGGADGAPVANAGVGTAGTTSPIVATLGAIDPTNGTLVVVVGASFYSAAATKTLTHTVTGGAATITATTNNGTSLARHYSFGRGPTTSHASADSDSFAQTTTSITGGAVGIVSFLLGPPVSVLPSAGAMTLTGAVPVVAVSSGAANWITTATAMGARMALPCTDSSGTQLLDGSGHSHPATLAGGYVLAQRAAPAGIGGNAVQLNGTTGYAGVADHADLDLANGPLTLEASIYLDAGVPAGNRLILAKFNGGYALRADEGGNLTFFRSQVAIIVNSTSTFSLGAWHHVIARKSGATVTLRIDKADVTGAVTDSTLVDTATMLGVGSETGDVWNDGWKGNLAGLAIYPTYLADVDCDVLADASTTATSITVLPAAASLTLSGATPAVLTPVLSFPDVAALVVTGATPAVTLGTPVQPSAAALVLTGATPSVLAPALSVPGAASLTLAGAVPAVLAPAVSVPNVASLTLTGAVPTVTTTANIMALPGAASLTLTGATPTVLVPLVSLPDAAALTLSGATPAVLTPVLSQPTAASLVLSGAVPAVLTPRVSLPSAASLTLTGATPSVAATANVTSLPGAAGLTLTGAVPTVQAGGSQVAEPVAAALTLTGATPSVLATANVWTVPDAAGLTLTGAIPDVTAGSSAVALPTAANMTLQGFAPVVTVTGVVTFNPGAFADGAWSGPPGPPLAELLADQAAAIASQDAAREAAMAAIAARMRNPWAEEERMWGLDDESLLGLVA